MTLKRTILAVVLIFLSVTPHSFLLADINIRLEDRVSNLDEGYCMWASVATAARHQKFKSLYNLVQIREKMPREKVYNAEAGKYVTASNGPAHPSDVVKVLKDMKIKFRYQDRGNYDLKLILSAMKEGKPCVISFYGYPKEGDRHAVTLIGIDSQNVSFIDSNCPGWKCSIPRSVFNQYWSGYALILDGE